MSQTRQSKKVRQERAGQVEHKTMTLPEVYERALRGGRYRRKGWDEKVGDVFVRRGETKLSIGDDRYAKPYMPSQEDAIAQDWVEV